MNTFENEFLRCRSGSSTPLSSPLHGLSLIPGPAPVVGLRQSVDIEEVAPHSIDSVRAAYRSFAGMTETRLDEGVWFFEWRVASRYIQIDLETFETEEWAYWSGSHVELDCLFSDVLEFWLTVARSLPHVWLHNDECTMFSPRAFVELIAAPALTGALESSEAALRDRASRERARYDDIVRAFEALSSIGTVR